MNRRSWSTGVNQPRWENGQVVRIALAGNPARCAAAVNSRHAKIRERADSVVRRVPRLDQLAAQSREPLTSQADQPARHLDFEEIVERLVMEDLNRGTGRKPEFAPVPKSGGIVVLS